MEQLKERYYHNDVFKDEVIELEKIQLDEGEKLYDVTVPKTLNFCLANGLCVRDKDVSPSLSHPSVRIIF
jgi:hypothetical protein